MSVRATLIIFATLVALATSAMLLLTFTPDPCSGLKGRDKIACSLD